MRIFMLFCLFACLSITSITGVAQTPDKSTDENTYKVVAYLTAFLGRQAEKPQSLRNRFVEFESIPADLNSSLTEAFPKHRFNIARTYYSHWVPDDGEAKILVVTDAASGDVFAHQWALWFGGESESFDHLLESYPARSQADALATVKLLAQLIVSLYPGKVGDIKIKKGTITADLYWGTDLWRVLKVTLDESNHFGPMTFVNPKEN